MCIEVNTPTEEFLAISSPSLSLDLSVYIRKKKKVAASQASAMTHHNSDLKP